MLPRWTTLGYCCLALCASVLEVSQALDAQWLAARSLQRLEHGPRIASVRATQAASLLEQRAHEIGSSQMEALALRIGAAATATSHGSPKNLDDVKELLRKMLASAQDAHSNDVGLHQFCTSETQRAKESVTSYGDRADKAKADVDKLSAEIDQATAKIADLHAEIADTQKQVVHNATERTKEQASYGQAKAELESTEQKHRDSLEALSSDDAAARVKLEHAAETALEKRIKMETAEASTDFNFQRAQQEGNDKVKLRGEQIKHEERAVLKMQSELVDGKQDLKGFEESLEAAKLYDTQVAKKCSVPTDSHAERAERRQQQMDSLKDAYNILSDDGATR